MSKAIEAQVTHTNGMAFAARSDSGLEITIDAAPESGGHDAGPRPMELFLMGLGGCTGMDVISILRKMQQDVTAYRVVVRGNRADEHPRVYTDILVEHRVSGRNLAVDRVARAVELSATKYCPASMMLSKAAKVEHSYVVIDEATGVEVRRAMSGQ